MDCGKVRVDAGLLLYISEKYKKVKAMFKNINKNMKAAEALV